MILAWINFYLVLQLALGLKWTPVDIEQVQHAVDPWLPLDFQPTWEMPGYAVDNAPSLQTVMLSSTAPVHVARKSIVAVGMVGSVDAGKCAIIDKLMGLCDWFDPGQCHVIVGYANKDEAATSVLEQKHQGRLEFLHDPPNLPAPRTWKYADIRNRLLMTGIEKNATYIMPSDLDGVVNFEAGTFGALTKAMAEYDDQWDATAFGSATYYDWWAARCALDSPNCWAIHPTTCWNAKYFQCIFEARGGPENKFVPVASAFNGVALYKTSQIGDCRYDGHQQPGRANESKDMKEDCEHVAFNNCLVKNGKRFMQSSLNITGR